MVRGVGVNFDGSQASGELLGRTVGEFIVIV